MSSFFDDASLVTIPSGYKDGKVYSVKPTSGNGDLTFTRNSNATRVDADGLVEKVRTNSLLQSNTFSNASWIKAAGTTVTSGQSGYDGTNDAWLLSKTAAYARIEQVVSFSGVFSFSIYAKAGTHDFLYLRLDDSGSKEAYFDLSTGTVGFNNVIATKVDSVGGGWYRCTIVWNAAAGTYARIYPSNANNGVGSSAAGNIYIQDAQLEQGLVATSYIETTTTAMSEFAGVTASSVADVPRLDYSGGSCPSLLLEPQRTNIIDQSEYIASWLNVNITQESNYATSPEGVQNATRVVMDSATGEHSVYESVSVTSGTQYTQSIFLKQGDGSANWRYFQFRFRYGGFGGLYGVVVDLQEGTIGYDTGLDDFGIEDYGNGWYRVWITATATTTSSSAGPVVAFNELADAYDVSIVGDTNADVLIYGAQAEAGSYPTSYIPTYGTTVTRLADACSKTGISSLIGSDAGTIYLEAAALANDLSERRFALSDGTTSNVARIGFTSVSNRILAVLYNGSNQCVLTYNGGDITAMNKIAFTWATNDFALFVNGVKRASDVSGSTFAPNTLNALHFNEGDGSGNEIEGKFDQVILFTSRLSDTELENLTA